MGSITFTEAIGSPAPDIVFNIKGEAIATTSGPGCMPAELDRLATRCAYCGALFAYSLGTDGKCKGCGSSPEED